MRIAFISLLTFQLFACAAPQPAAPALAAGPTASAVAIAVPTAAPTAAPGVEGEPDKPAVCKVEKQAPLALTIEHEVKKEGGVTLRLAKLRTPIAALNQQIDRLAKQVRGSMPEFVKGCTGSCDLQMICGPKLNTGGLLSGQCDVKRGYDTTTVGFTYGRVGGAFKSLTLREVFDGRPFSKRPKQIPEKYQQLWDGEKGDIVITPTEIRLQLGEARRQLDLDEVRPQLRCAIRGIAKEDLKATLGQPRTALSCPKSDPKFKPLKIRKRNSVASSKGREHGAGWFTTGVKIIDKQLAGEIAHEVKRWRKRKRGEFPNCGQPNQAKCTMSIDCTVELNDGRLLSAGCFRSDFYGGAGAVNFWSYYTFQRTSSGWKRLAVKDVLRDVDEFKLARKLGEDCLAPKSRDATSLVIGPGELKLDVAYGRFGCEFKLAEIRDDLTCAVLPLAGKP